MPALTYEIGARNNRLKQALKDSKDAVKDLRRHAREQFRDMSREVNDSGGFGKELKQNLFGQMTKANLAATAITKTVGAVRDGVAAIGEMVDASEQLGVSAESLSKLQRVMQGAGVEVENLRKAFISLNQARLAAKGGDDKALASFAQLGVTTEQLDNLEETFFAVADGIAAIKDPAEAAGKAMELIGTRNAKLIGGMREGSEELKKRMSEVVSVTEANAKAVDDTSDSLSNLWGAAKAGAANAAGGVINAFKAGVNGWENAVEKMKGAENTAAAEEEKKAAHQKEVTDEAEKQRLLALRNNAARNEEEKTSRRILDLAKEHTESERERAELLRESYTRTEKLALAIGNVVEARKRYDAAPAGIPKDEAGANLAAARVGMEKARQKEVDRFALPLAERKEAERAERENDRAQRKGERVFSATARDKIDRDFRAGRIDEKKRDAMMEEMRVKKGEGGAKENLPEESLKELQTIRGQLEGMAEKLGVVP